MYLSGQVSGDSAGNLQTQFQSRGISKFFIVIYHLLMPANYRYITDNLIVKYALCIIICVM